MSRALVALDYLRELTDGSPADLAALLVEVVAACPIAGPWQEVRIHLSPLWSREVVVRSARGDQFPALVEVGYDGHWVYRVGGRDHYGGTSPEAARDACDAALRAAGWTLLD